MSAGERHPFWLLRQLGQEVVEPEVRAAEVAGDVVLVAVPLEEADQLARAAGERPPQAPGAKVIGADDRVLLEWVTSGDHRHQWLGVHDPVGETVGPRTIDVVGAPERGVEVLALERIERRRHAAPHAQLDDQVGVPLVEPPDEIERCLDRTPHVELQRPSRITHGVRRTVCCGDELTRVRQQPLTGCGQFDASTAAPEQMLAEGTLQALDAFGQRLLTEEQVLSSPPEVPLVGHLDESSHLSDVEIHAPTLHDNRRLSKPRWELLDSGPDAWSRRGMNIITDVAAGVPFVALPPAESSDEIAPMIVVWHLFDAPRSDTAMAAALPLAGLRAWRVYLGLPLCGSRLPAGGHDEVMRLGSEDAVLNLFGPVTAQAVDEFGTALPVLRERLPIDRGPIVLVGASAGALVALSVLADTDVPVRAMTLISPAIRLASVVTANERRFNVTYAWNEASLRIAERLDFLERSDEIADRDIDVLLVTGELDDDEGFREPARRLCDALSGSRVTSGRATLVEIPGMVHALAEEPGIEPAPQTVDAARVDAAVTAWLARQLGN